MKYDKHMNYRTEYGDVINCEAFSGLSDNEIRYVVMHILEKGNFKNASPLKTAFPVSVKLEGRVISGRVVPIAKWKAMISILGFRQSSSSSEGWVSYHISGLTGNTDYQSSWGTMSYIEFEHQYSSPSSLNIQHSISINYRTTTGNFTTYVGNVEDFFNQIILRVNSDRINKDFGL